MLDKHKHKHAWKIINANVENPDVYFECKGLAGTHYIGFTRSKLRAFLKGEGSLDVYPSLRLTNAKAKVS